MTSDNFYGTPEEAISFLAKRIDDLQMKNEVLGVCVSAIHQVMRKPDIAAAARDRHLIAKLLRKRADLYPPEQRDNYLSYVEKLCVTGDPPDNVLPFSPADEGEE